MRPEIVVPLLLQRRIDVEILQLGKSEEGGCGDNTDPEDLCEAAVVEIKWVLEREFAVTVRVHSACVFDDVDVAGRPSCCYVADNDLLQEAPVAGEANEKGCGDLGVRFWGSVP